MFQPTTFGKYFLTRRIAVGGMAEVYAAKLYGADGFEKDLVIKQILPQHARDPEFVQSFVAEAKIAVGLSHTNIVAIYELGRVDGTYFIAMEFVDGLDAFALIESARRHEVAVPVACAARIVEDVALGLDYAHRRTGTDGQPIGLVHRDLNPRNVLVSKEGEVKILDFGIAKTAPGVTDMPKTRAGVVKGTTGYMSPEQAAGREIDARTDIYQAGLLLFELITGEPLFWSPDEAETRKRMREHVVVAPSIRRPGVPSALDQVVLKALARDPAQRFQSAGAFATELAAARVDCDEPGDTATLGALVRELRTRDAQAVERASGEYSPAIGDISDVISEAIEQSLTGRIETFARSGGLPEPATRPVTGSTPLDMPTDAPPPAAQVLLTANGDLVRGAAPPATRAPSPAPPRSTSTPPPRSASSPRAGGATPLPRVGTPARPAFAPGSAAQARTSTLPPASPTGTMPPTGDVAPQSRGLVVTAGLVVLLALAGFALRDMRRDDIPPPAAKAPPDVAQAPTRTTTAPPAAADTATVSATASLAAATPVAARPRAPAPRYGVVDFGTRSCSSRVTVDGRIVTRTTPSFGHQLVAGDHAVLIEGTSCPPVERPGSLQRGQPVLSGRFRLPAGGALKVIADFSDARLIVRKVPIR